MEAVTHMFYDSTGWGRMKASFDLTGYLVHALMFILTPAIGALWLLDKIAPKAKSDNLTL